jgi:hypothetical protein
LVLRGFCGGWIGGGAVFYMDCLQLLIGVVLLLNARKVARFMTMR